jgi:exopolysaccharide biosynthesis WecB/TagA/CpsF family protein
MDVPKVEVLGLEVSRLTPERALALVEELADAPGPATIAFANAHTLNLACDDPGYLAVLRRFSAVFNDGTGMAIAARLKRSPFPANLNGSDFSPRILELCARRGWSVYLLGSKPGVAERAAERLKAQIPGLEIAGCHHGFLAPDENEAVARRVRESGAEVVFVAMGNPLQELWLDRHLAATGARLGVGVGAFLDFAAGEVPRAPAWMNRWGIEWIYRLWHEPRRLWRRYLLGIPLFLWRVSRALLAGRRARPR